MEKKEPLVTRERVFKAADDIHAAGRRVSVRTIAREIGGGSPRDICPLLREWKTMRASSAAGAKPDAPVPTEIDRAFREVLGRLTTAVREEVNGQFEGERRAVQQRIDAALSECDDLATDVAEADAEIAELNSRLLVASSALSDARNRSLSLEAQLDAERQSRVLAEARESEVRQRDTDLATERDAHRTALELANQALERLRQESEANKIEAARSGSEAMILRSQNRVTMSALQKLSKGRARGADDDAEQHA